MAKPVFIRACELLQEIPKIDCHIHTSYSDGKASPTDFVTLAIKKRFTYICFTEHVDKTTTWYGTFKQEVVALREHYAGKLDICYGIEVRAANYDGQFNADPDLVRQAEVIMGVVHSYPDSKGKTFRLDEINRDQALELEYKTTIGLLEKGDIDILGHPGATYEQHFGNFPIELYRDLIKLATKANIAIEINPRYLRDFKGFVELCLEEDPLVSLGSDAHTVDELGRVYYMLQKVLRT